MPTCAMCGERRAEIERLNSQFDEMTITVGKAMERANHWEKEARNISIAYDTAEATIERLTKQRDKLLAAAENLAKVKGRYHTEQAYKALVDAIASVKGEG